MTIDANPISKHINIYIFEYKKYYPFPPFACVFSRDQRARDMTQTGKSFLSERSDRAIDITASAAIVPATEMRQYLDARLPRWQAWAAELHSLVVLERDLSVATVANISRRNYSRLYRGGLDTDTLKACCSMTRHCCARQQNEVCLQLAANPEKQDSP